MIQHAKYTTSFHYYCRRNVMIVVVACSDLEYIDPSKHQQNLAALNVQMLQKFLLSINNKTLILCI